MTGRTLGDLTCGQAPHMICCAVLHRASAAAPVPHLQCSHQLTTSGQSAHNSASSTAMVRSTTSTARTRRSLLHRPYATTALRAPPIDRIAIPQPSPKGQSKRRTLLAQPLGIRQPQLLTIDSGWYPLTNCAPPPRRNGATPRMTGQMPHINRAKVPPDIQSAHSLRLLTRKRQPKFGGFRE